MFIADRMGLIDSSGIREVFDLARSLENPINLSIGQPDFDIPNPIKDEAIRAIKEGFNRYTLTSGIPELKDKLLTLLKKIKSSQLDDIIITSGVSGGLLLSFLCLINNGDEVIIPDPYFVSYKHLVNLVGGVPIYINTYPDFSLPADKIEAVISKKTKLLLLNSPSNPTGKVYSKKELLDIVELAKRHNLFIISDEIYDKFVFDGEYISISSLYDNVLVLGGFSKTLGMTGWRIGYAVGRKEVIQQMTVLQQYTFVCAPSFAQRALIKYLDYDISDEIANYKKKRDLVIDSLRPEFNVVIPGGAFYCFIESPMNSAKEFVKRAIANNLLIIPGSVFSERDSHFRLSFAVDNKELVKGIKVLNHLYDI